jgi:hypothetical protein
VETLARGAGAVATRTVAGLQGLGIAVINPEDII